jgi:hypothetical protein
VACNVSYCQAILLSGEVLNAGSHFALSQFQKRIARSSQSCRMLVLGDWEQRLQGNRLPSFFVLEDLICLARSDRQ